MPTVPPEDSKIFVTKSRSKLAKSGKKLNKKHREYLRRPLGSLLAKMFSPETDKICPRLGYSAEELKINLNSKLTVDTSWDNYGSYWTVGYLRPIASFPEDASPREVNALDNLTPVPITEKTKKYEMFFSKKIVKDPAYTFDDVLLIPQYSGVGSRRDVDLSTDLSCDKSLVLRLPLVSAPMDTITQGELAYAMHVHGGLGIIHRYQSLSDRVAEVRKVKSRDMKSNVGIAVGLQDQVEDVVDILVQEGISTVCFDVAHVHAAASLKYIEKLKNRILSEIGDHYPIIAGNIATFESALDLRLAGANVLKVGIGGGAACSTRIITGAGVPMISSVMDVRDAVERFRSRPKIIADGGHRYPADIAKSLAAGADAVMLGSMLASTEECPGSVLVEDGKKYKVYRGMASKDAQEDWVGMKPGTVAEGVSTKLPYKGSLSSILDHLSGSLRSSLSYSGAFTLGEFFQNSAFRLITQSGLEESHPHILDTV